MKIKINFFKKLFLFSLGVIFVTIFVGYILNISLLDEFYIYRKKRFMENVKIEVEKLQNNPFELDEYIDTMRELEGIEIRITKPNNHGMMDMMHGRYPITSENKFKNKKFKISTVQRLGVKLLIYNDRMNNGKNISIRTSLSVMAAHKHEIYLFNLMTSIIAILFAAIIGRIFSKKLTRDIEKLNKTALEISKMNFPKQIVIKRDDEIGELSESIEKMSHNLSISINNLKSFVSNASHELKTPLAVLSTHLEALLNGKIVSPEKQKKYLDILLKETNEMKELVSNLLTISKISSPDYKVVKERLDLNSLISNALEKYEFLELDKDIIVIKNVENISIHGDPHLIKLAINNIVQNGLKYSVPESELKIYSKQNIIYFENHMEFILNEEEISQLFNPFSRGDNALEGKIEGTGLGLSIVKQALELNHLEFGINLNGDIFIFWIKL